MAYGGSLGSISNKGDWSESIQVTDSQTGDLIDLTGASITVNVAASQSDCLAPSLTGSTATGEVVLPALGIFQFNFPSPSLGNLCSGTYRVGIIISRDGETLQLFLGNVTVEQGL